MSISQEIAKKITEINYATLPEAAVSAAKIAILDTLGVTIAGASDPSAVIARRVLNVAHSSGDSVSFGTGYTMSCLDAAFINGIAAHALDFDDCSDTMGGHPSAPIIPALIALGEQLGANGQEIINAYVAGFETEVKLGRGVNFYHYDKGWHPTATLGIFGAAAACARLLELPQHEIASALSLSASMAAGVKANFGSMGKPLHVGNSSRSGLLAALLAKDGFTANPHAFEHKQGFLYVFNGEGTFDTNKIFSHWADPLEIVRPGFSIKQYPCCASTHAAIDAMITMVCECSIDPERVCKIKVAMHARRLVHVNRPYPNSGLEAKFSLQYCLARALANGRVVLEDFEGSAFNDERIRRLATLVEVAAFTQGQSDSSNECGVDVTVEFCDGEKLSKNVKNPMGQSVSSPLTNAQLQAKFENCAGRSFSKDHNVRLFRVIQRLDELADIRELTALLKKA